MKFKRVMSFTSALMILVGCVSSSQPDSQMSSSASDISDVYVSSDKASEAVFDVNLSYDTDDSSENTSTDSQDNTTAAPIYFFDFDQSDVYLDYLETRQASFLAWFPTMYPDFEMLDYTLGACDTSPIQAVIVANNTNENRATFFILDHEGVGTISFDDEKKILLPP